MANNARKRFTVQLDVEPKISTSQVQAVLKNLGAIFSDFQKKSEKMTYFQELVDYLHQIDSELTRLKKIHGAKAVNKAFGGLGESIQKQLQEGLMMNGQDFSQFDVLRKKINDVVQSGGKITELVPIIREINTFFDLLGRSDMHLDTDIGGDVRAQADTINQALDEVVESFNLVRRNITVGLSGSGNGPSFDISNMEETALTYDKLREKILALDKAIKQYDKGLEIDSDGISLEDKIDELNEYIVNLDKTGEKAELIYQILGDLQFHGIDENQALMHLCDILQVDLPKGIVKFQEFMKIAEQFRDFNYISKEDSDTGIQKLEAMKAELVDLAKQGDITADQLDQVNTVFNTAMMNLKKMDHDSHKGPGMGDGSGLGTGTAADSVEHIGTVDVDFTRLENAISSEAKRIVDKLNQTLDVNVVSDMTKISSAVNEVKGLVEKISSEIDAYKASQVTDARQVEIDAMKQNLSKLLAQTSNLNNKTDLYGNPQKQEMSAQFMSNGSIATSYGEKGSVPWNRVIAQLVKNLNSDLVMDVHSHPFSSNYKLSDKYFSDFFSGSKGDLSAWRKSKNFGAQLSGMIAGNILRTFDISKLDKNQYEKFITNLNKIELEYSKDSIYGKYVSRESDGSTKYYTPDSLEKMHMTSKVFEEMMYKALKGVGFSQDQIDEEIFKKYDLTNDEQLTQLATKLVDLNTSAQSTIAPVQRLSDILQVLGVNTASSEVTTALLGFEKGEIPAVDVINRFGPDWSHISEDLVNSVQTIDYNKEPSMVESTLNGILDILTTINTTINNIQTNIKPNASSEYSNTIDDVLRITHGAGLDNITSGTKSIYDSKNISKYQNDAVIKIAKNSVGEFLMDVLDASERVKDGNKIELSEVDKLITSFKTSVANVEDALRQVMLYESSAKEKALTNIDGQEEKATDYLQNLKKSLLDIDEAINPLLQILKNARDEIRLSEDQYDIGTVKTSQATSGNSSVKYNSNISEISQEKREIEELIRFLNQVKVAVDAKTLSFEKEGNVVQSVVQSEENQLDILESRLDKVTIAIDNNTDAFVSGKTTVDSIIDAEINKLNELCKKLIEVKLSISEVSQLYGKQTAGATAPEVKPTANNEVDNIQKKAEAYDKLIERIKDLINLSKKTKNTDMRLLPNYNERGQLQTNGTIGSRNIVDNHASKSLVRKVLDLYNSAKDIGSDNTVELYMKDLITCVATYKNLDDARDIFKKNELNIWEEVINRINAAKEAKEAYDKYNARNDRVLLDAAKLGDVQDKAVTLGDVWKFDKVVDTGDLDKILGYLEKKFQLKAPKMTADINANISDGLQPVNQENVIELDALKQKALEVKNAINEQVEAFEREKSMVNTSVDAEVTNLETLRQKLIDVANAVEAKTCAFEEEYVTVDAAVNAEMIQLNALLELLKQITAQIGILNDGFSNTGKNTITSGGTITVNHEMSKEYALDTTLHETNSILDNILIAINNNESMRIMTGALSVAVQSLKDVTNGIVQHQKTQKSDTKVAMARIQDPKKLAHMSGLAKDSIGDLGTDSEIESYQALTNGLVKFEGVFKNAQGQWEGFTVKVNEHNEAVDLAIKKHSALANKLNNTGSLDDNPVIYNKEEVEARAQRHLDEYTAQGKNATVQFKDSGRYTITILEEIDGLTKKIFQTFDENDKMIERTTVTISNSQKTKLENLQKKLIDDGINKGLISANDEAYGKYLEEKETLKKLNDNNAGKDNLTDEEIANWKQQIALVQQLGGEVENLIQQRKKSNEADDAVFSKMKDKKKNIGQYQIKLAGLDEKSEADIPVIKEIQEILGVLNNEYAELENQLNKPLSTEQLEELSIIAEKTADSIKIVRAEMEGSIAAKNKKNIKKIDDDNAKSAQKEVDDAFSKMEKKKKAIGELEVALAKLDKNSEKDAPKIKEIVNILERLKQEYAELEGGFGEFLSREQVDKLNSITQDTADNISLANANKEGVAAKKNSSDAAKKLKSDFKKLKSLAKEMGEIEIQIAGSKDEDEIRDLTNILDKLKAEYEELYSVTNKKLDSTQVGVLNKIFADTIRTIRDLKKEMADLSTKEASALELFKSDKDKKLSQFDKDKANLEKDEPIDAKYDVIGARATIENATDKDQLKLAMNAWAKLKNEIQQARIEAEKLKQETHTVFDDKKLQAYSKQIDEIFKDLGFGINDTGLDVNQQTVIDKYQEVLELINKIKKEQIGLTSEEETDLKAKIGDLENKAKPYIENTKAEKEKQKADSQFKTKYDKELDSFDKYVKSVQNADYLTTELRTKIEGLKEQLLKVKTGADLSTWQEEFTKLKHDVDVAESSFKSLNDRIINTAQGTANASIKGLGFNVDSSNLNSEQQKVADAYNKVGAVLEEYKINVEEGKRVEISRIEAVVAALKNEADAYRKVNDIANVNTKNFGATAMRREDTRYGKLDSIRTTAGNGYSDSPEFLKKFKAYKDKYDELVSLQKQFANSDVLTNEQVAQWDKLKDTVANMGKELEKSWRASEKLSDSGNWVLLGSDFTDDESGRKRALTDYIKAFSDADIQSIEFKNNYKKCVALIKDSDGAFRQVTATIDIFGNKIVSTMDDAGESVSNLQKFFDLAKVKFGQILTYLAASFGIEEIFQQIRQGITYIKEIDDALTELKKVTNETDAEYQHFLQNMSKTASVVGSTITDLTKSAADWARIGYSMQDAGKLAATTAKLLNVSEFESVDDATSALVSSLQAFADDGKDATQRAEEIVDILNNIGNKYPVATNELADGLATSSAALVAANNSIEEQVAMLAAGNATMQDISAVASGLKIVAARLRGTTSEADDDAESAVTNVSKLQEKIKNLTAEANNGEGIDIINEDGSYKSTYEILNEISKIFDQMDDMSQASLLELIAGKNRSSVVAAILQNGEILEKAYSDAFDSKGSAQKELDTYLNSIQGKIDKFTNSLQTMWMNLISSDFIKWVVDLGTAAITAVDKIGLFPTALMGIVGYFSLIKKISPIGIFKELGGVISGYSSAIQQLNTLSQSSFDTQTITAYAQAVSGLSAKKQALALAGAGLNRQQIQEVLTRNQVNDATIEQIMSEGQLAAAKNLTTTATVAETVAIEANKNTTLSADAQKWLLDNSTKQLTLDLLHEAVAHEIITKETAEEIATKNHLIATNQQATSTSSSLWKTFSAMPLLGKISLAVTAIGALFTIGKKIYDYFNPSTEELVQKWDDFKNEIDNINSELKTTQARIDELNSKGVLSITDKQELQQLKQTNDELERRLRLTEQNAEDAGNKAKKKVKEDYEKEFVFAPVVTNKAKKEYNEAYNAQLVIDSMKTMPDFSTWETIEQYQKNAFANLAPDLYKKVIDKALYDLDETTQEELFAFEAKLYKQMSNLEASALGEGAVRGEDYIDQAIQRIKELKDELYDANGQIKPNIDDEYAKEVYDQINELENGLISASGELYEYMDQYGGDAGDAFVQGLQTQIDKIDMTVNPIEYYSKKFDEVLGKYSDDKIKLYELAKAGKLSSDVLNGVNYEPLMRELRELGITAQDVVDHITALSETEITKVTDPTFNIADYASNIDDIQEKISEYQSALESLEDGSFTYSDFIDLTQKFPDLAKGVDTSSKKFNGLAKNLRKAIKASPEELVDELKDLRKQLQANGKSTVEIDQLIDSIENLPVESVKNLSDEYITLADEINAAKKAQNELQEAMNENPNEGYETRGEALEYMKDKMGRGEIGSESELWDVAKEAGFIYDHTKSLNENADALARWIAIREEWFAKNDDGEYTFAGTEEFIQDVENAVNSNERLKEILQWDYNEETGIFSFDFDNANLEEIITLLGQTEDLAGLTAEEFHDMLVQIGQYFGLNWEDVNDVKTHLDTIASSASDAKTKVEEYGEAMQAGFGKDTKIDLTNRPRLDAGDGSYETVDSRAYSSEDETITITVTPILPDGTKLTDEELQKYTEDIINGADPATYEFEVNGKTYTGDDIVLARHYGDDSIDQANEYGKALHEAQEQYYALVDEMKSNPFSIKVDGDIETDIIAPLKEAGLQVDEVIDEAGNKQFTFEIVDLETLMRNNGYDTENVMAVVNRIFGEGSENSKLVQLREDILNIGYISGDVLDTLDEIGASYVFSGSSQGARITIDSNVDELLANLHFTDTEIEALKKKWEENGIYVKADVTEVENSQETLDDQPENVTTTVDLNTDSFHKKIAPVFDDLDELTRPRTATVTINTTTKETVVKEEKYVPAVKSHSNIRQSMINVDGTAHAQGSWGVKESGTSLVGELGPEILVRDGRWTTVGENGAEFTQVRRGDIIFNHKQSKQLLENGYVTGRGKLQGSNSAFASGTAFASGGGGFASYDFGGDGTYTKYDVNDKAVESYGELSNAANDLSNAASDISDAANDFKETFDWVEVRLEEIDEDLNLLSAQLENASNYSAKNNIVDNMIGVNQVKIENLVAGIEEYSEYASKLLNEVPAKFREAAQNGEIAITDFAGEANEATVEAISNYREWAQKVADLRQQLEEVKTEIKDLARQKFDNIYEAGDVRATVEDSQTEKLQNAIDLIEESGRIATEEYYTAMMENSNMTIKYLTQTRDEMQKVFDEAVEAGIIVRGSNEWYEMIDQLYQIDAEIDGATKELEEFQNAINDIYWSNFDQLINRLDYLKDETQNLIDLMDDVDLVDDNGDWTDEGLASLGLYAQQMEIAEYQSKQYAEAIDDLTADYEAGLYSENEYMEKLAELKDAQYDSIKAYDEAKKAIVDLNKTRIDAIKEGIEEEIDAYEELINKKKEALDAEKDLYDFQKGVADQQKTIAEIERQLAALANDNSLSAAAKRKQLEAELAEAQYELQDTYYNRSVEDKQSALDKELEDFKTEKEAEIEAWDEYLENIELVVAESLGVIQANASGIYDTLMEKANEYDLTVSDAIMTPWQDGAFAVSDYQEQFDTAMSSTMNQLEALKNKWQEVIDKMLEASRAEVSGIHSENNNYASAEKKPEQAPSAPPASNNKPKEEKTIKVGGKINASGAKIYSSIGSKGQNQYYSKDPVYVVLEEKSGYLKVRHHSAKSGVTGWFKKSDVKAYAKGSSGVSKDQWALIDELGEELQIVPGQNGRLEYIKKGTAIIPSDLTNRLVDLAMNPQEMLDRNRPSINVSPSIVTNTIEVNMSIAEVVHIDKVDNDTIPDLTKAVRKEMDSYMGKLNNAIKSKVR